MNGRETNRQRVRTKPGKIIEKADTLSRLLDSVLYTPNSSRLCIGITNGKLDKLIAFKVSASLA